MVKKIVLLMLFLHSVPVLADSMRCGSRVVVDGDEMAHVLLVCGKPVDVQKSQRFVQRELKPGSGDSKVVQEINTERWTYTFKDGSLPKILTFENGILIRIDVSQSN